MVVKSASKKKLMDMGVPMIIAHAMAEERTYGYDYEIESWLGNKNVRNKMENKTYPFAWIPILLLTYEQWNTLIEKVAERIPHIYQVSDTDKRLMDTWMVDKNNRDSLFLEMNEDRIRRGLPAIPIVDTSFINWRQDPFTLK